MIDEIGDVDIGFVAGRHENTEADTRILRNLVEVIGHLTAMRDDRDPARGSRLGERRRPHRRPHAIIDDPEAVRAKD